jgi:hypothetical protein
MNKNKFITIIDKITKDSRFFQTIIVAVLISFTVIFFRIDDKLHYIRYSLANLHYLNELHELDYLRYLSSLTNLTFLDLL